MKPGIKTTEFWLTLATAVIGALATMGAFTNSTVVQVVGIIMTILSSMGYTYTRFALKSTPSVTPVIPTVDTTPITPAQ